MILDSLANADRYAPLHPRFAAAFEFLRRPGLEALAPGRIPILGDDLFVIISKSPGRQRADAKLECHRRYIDIQFIIAGTDEMGWRPAAGCGEPVAAYNPDRDIAFFADPAETWIATPAGAFCIFFPTDAHAPLVGEGEIHKAVVKVAV
jgi:biofilm protein TabA